MRRTTLTIEGHSYVLAQGTETATLKASAEEAVVAGGKFVDLTVVGNIAVSVLVSPGVAIVITTQEVPDDPRDTGHLSEPYSDDNAWDIADLF
ncbi:hypothetical protein [Mycetocola zhadangensis]|uniref:Uncharacterized protein n=1 Tax=Mycetocola zhadangensis TaxID=1164595 RepID=A0A3L7J0Z2_9MICO|nr:hypothetical protein [Mycetocola zhadangensis]RLQ84153.1 hypothetical protein D9V28_07955 [Mycetocola zhadangensis]GGE95674.1 hypothetical protein GCM10011313_18310 [Mycetocola zhadangensis]